MKKIIAVLAVVVSAGAFAQTMDHSAHQNMGGNAQVDHSVHQNQGRMMNQIESLTPEQQSEYNELHAKHRSDMQKTMLDIKELDLKIQKEMLAEKPNQKNLDKLIDQKAGLQAKKQKDMLKFKLDAKEKFGVEMMGMMNGDKKCKMMGMKKGGMMMNDSMKMNNKPQA